MNAGPRILRRVPFLVLAGVAGAAASCALATGEVTGGGLTEAGAAATTPFDSGVTVDTALVERACSTPEWAAIYRDILGRVGHPGSCAFNATCHGTPEGAGAGTGIQCFNERGCCWSMFITGLVEPENATFPEKSGLIRVLRRATDGGRREGFMPKEPTDYVFSDESLEQIEAWIRLLGSDGGLDAGMDTGDAVVNDAGND